jgi:uncharacterized membrane protein
MSNVTYSIAPVSGATSYSWNVPPGVSIVNNSGTSITVNFTPAFKSNSADICVRANNACGSGVERCFTITSRPAAPVISGPASVCKTQSAVNYTLTPVASATSYLWSVSGGASIAPGGTSAVINYNTLVSTSPVIRANAVNACGTSQPAALNVSASLFCRSANQNDADGLSQFVAYPNPSKDLVTIEFNSTTDETYVVNVTDITGKIISTEEVRFVNGVNYHYFHLKTLSPGIYFVSLKSANTELQVQRVVKN